jgi:hypothetical protein
MFGRSPGRSVSCVCERVLSCARLRPHSHSVGHSALRPELRAVAACSPVNAGRQVQLDEGKRMPLGLAFAFLGVQLAVFGLYMGASFAPNHVGMPRVPREAKLELKQAGTHLTQRRWRLVGHGADGRTQLPDRTPPVPDHATTAPEQGASACAGALPVERRAVHGTSLITAWGIVVRYRRGCCSRGLSNSCLLPTPNGGRQ